LGFSVKTISSGIFKSGQAFKFNTSNSFNCNKDEGIDLSGLLLQFNFFKSANFPISFGIPVNLLWEISNSCK